MIPAERSHLQVEADTHPGIRGKNNEDQFSVTAYKLSALNPTPSLFAIVADGIGGHRAGEVAAEIAVEMIGQAIAQSDASQPTAIMQAAIIQANQAILVQSANDPEKQGMGTTCVCAWVIGDQLYAASVGNSRLYLIRHNQLHQLTTDHTWVQEAIDAGAITQDQARTHPHSNIIRRYLGSPQAVEVDLRLQLTPREAPSEKNQGMRLLPGDRLVLCSDGLNDMVEDHDIFDLANSSPLNDVVPGLIDQANQNGGKDNITVIAIDVPEGMAKFGVPAINISDRRFGVALSYGGLLLMGLVVLAAMVVFAWQAVYRSPRPTLEATATSTPSITVVTPTP